MKRILSLAAGLALLMGSLAPAAVITVSKNAADNANASTIGAAVDLASSGDTIRILDSALYSEDFRLPVNMKSDLTTTLNSLTIEAVGTPTLERPAGATAGPVIRFGPGSATTTVTGPYAIRGASPTAKMTIRQIGATNPCINTGANQASAHSITFENLILEKPTDAAVTGSDGLFINFVCAGSQTVNNVDLIGRKSACASAAVQLGCTQGTTVTISNLDCSGINGNNVQIINYILNANGTSGDLVFNNCKIMPNAASRAAAPSMCPIRDSGTVKGTVTFNDCHFNEGGGGGWFRSFDISSETIYNLNRPVFEGGMGDVAFHLFGTASSVNGPTLNITGDPKTKVSFDAMAQGGTVLPFRMLAGSVSMTDVTATVKPGTFALLDTTFEGATWTPINLTLNRCYFADDCGAIVLDVLDGTAKPIDSPQPMTLTATNTIWAGATSRGDIIDSTANKMNTGARTLTFNHCTLMGKTGNILVGLDPQMDPNPVANYCIFDSSQTPSKAANGTHKLTGKGNLSWSGKGANSKLTWWPGEPADTIYGDPTLNASGHISIDSLAGGAAIGSAETVDVDGQLRPLGGTTPDIGADETYAVPVELSGFSAE